MRLPNVQIVKGGGRGTGNAYIGWDGTYSFNFNAQRHSGRVHHREQEHRHAAVGAAQFQRRG